MDGARWITSNGLCPDGVVGREGGRDEAESPTVEIYLLVQSSLYLVI